MKAFILVIMLNDTYLAEVRHEFTKVECIEAGEKYLNWMKDSNPAQYQRHLYDYECYEKVKL